MSYLYTDEPKGATAATAAHNAAVASSADPAYLAEEDADAELVTKHMLFELPDEEVLGEDGTPVLARRATSATGPAPDTANPYLWHCASRNRASGIVELVPGKAYSTVSMGVAAIGFIRTKHGWVIQDTGASVEEGALALDTFERALGETVRDSIKAVIISHTHFDHFGGLEAFVPTDRRGDIPVYAPDPYLESLNDDNLYTGIAMARRLQYQGGRGLEHGPKGALPFLGSSSRLPRPGRVSAELPTVYVSDRTELDVDGLHLTLIPTPHTETTAHMVTYFHEPRVLFLADDVMGTLHNTLTMRGARVRDANYWGKALFDLALEFGDEAEAVFYGHDIPLWKDDDDPGHIRRFLLDNAVAYKFPNDQALLMANEGRSPDEIGRDIELPESVTRPWYVRPHYGDYTFNARAAYQRYLGFYDGNPVNLLPLSRRELATRLVSYMGSADEILKRAEQDFDAGDYQWVATVTNYLVFADPSCKRARYLCADALEQLGYQAESGLWRNAYLSAARELRGKRAPETAARYMTNAETVGLASASDLLDYLGVSMDGARAEGEARASAPVEYHSSDGLRFLLTIRDDVTEHGATEPSTTLVSIYKGVVFHHQLAPEEAFRMPGLPSVSTTRQALYLLAQKRYKGNQALFETNRPDILAWLDDLVVDLSAYQDFPLVAPAEE